MTSIPERKKNEIGTSGNFSCHYFPHGEREFRNHYRIEMNYKEPSFLWYSIAMLYKYSTLPVIASVVYIVLIAKDWPFVYGLVEWDE